MRKSLLIFLLQNFSFRKYLKLKEVKKMNIQEEIQKNRAHSDHLKKIALKLFEQLKSEKVDFSDAERIISMLSAFAKSERDSRIL